MTKWHRIEAQKDALPIPVHTHPFPAVLVPFDAAVASGLQPALETPEKPILALQ